MLRYAFYAFIFTIPIETFDIGIQRGVFSLSHLMGYLFIGAALLQPEVSFKRLPSALRFFAAYVLVFTYLAIVQQPEDTSFWIGSYSSLWGVRLATHVQMLILFCFAFNCFQDPRVVKGGFLSLGLSCVLLSIILIAGRATNAMAQGRFTALSQDANTVGSLLSLGLLALLGLAYGRNAVDKRIGLLAWMCFGVLGAGIVMTGSRGALLSLIVGVIGLMAKRGQSAVRVKMIFIAVFTIACLAWASYEDPALRMRWGKSITEGNFAGREQLIPEAWRMFVEKPLMGWGPVTNIVELGLRFNEPSKDTHNSYLWVLTETGLLGGIPFLCGLYICLRAAWRARGGVEGSLPLIFITCLLMINMSVTWLNRKQFWLLLAYAMASESALLRSLRATKLSIDGSASRAFFQRDFPTLVGKTVP